MPTTFLKSTSSVRIMYLWKSKLGFAGQWAYTTEQEERKVNAFDWKQNLKTIRLSTDFSELNHDKSSSKCYVIRLFHRPIKVSEECDLQTIICN